MRFISTGGFAVLVLLCGMLLYSCANREEGTYLFNTIKGTESGLRFANRLESTDSFNLFKYMYFYNGAGVGAGDFNNDGLIDVFFAANQGSNAMYLNKGNLRFSEVTESTGIPREKAWNTGVSVVDINNDGLLDIYVSRVGRFETLNSHNLFLICEGISASGVPRYKDRAKEMGVDFSGFGTQAAFLDFDLDGDLDMFLLNHSIHESGNFRERHLLLDSFNTVSGSRLFRNDGTVFHDVTRTSGIFSTAIGYGLGIAVSDINNDGYPDIYIGNDFHENDYLYINQKNGTFRDEAASALMHTSRYTMGVDVADANNDGLTDIFTVDMLPADPYILKRSPGEDSYDVFNMKINYGYSYQYSRNALQFNRGNGSFSETALYSGVAATDWSWSPLLFDFDNDGLKDLFISNGIPKRLNDIDYINYISDQSIQQQIIENRLNEKDNSLIDKFPKIRIPDKFYRNKGNLKFEDLHDSIANIAPGYSNGAAYADFDNDGDLDVVVNNIDDFSMLYQNLASDKHKRNYLSLRLKGPSGNINATGAKVIVYSGEQVSIYEKYPVRGFMSSMEMPVHIGMATAVPDSVLVIWPDNTFQRLTGNLSAGSLEVVYLPGLPVYQYAPLKKNAGISHPVQNITKEVQLDFRHEENPFPEFDREPLMPHMISTEGPALAVGDANGDGLDDVFFGASKGRKRALFIQRPDGKFENMPMPALQADSSFEDVDACWTDINNDSINDLVVASGGNEYYGKDRHLLPRVYINDGKGNLTRKADAITGIFQTSGCVAAHDFDGDGHTDLFIGGRGVPWQFGVQPASYLLRNDGTGHFTDVTARFSPAIGNAGFVTGARWLDVNGDGATDLVVCSEWGTIDAYLHTPTGFTRKVIADHKGWWNFILPIDVNGDGKMDLIAGNTGMNNRIVPSDRQPVRMYYNDFDDNGKKEQVLTYYVEGKEIPFANKAEMERQLPVMRKRFLYAKDFASATLEEIVTDEKLSGAELLSANYFYNCVLINQGDLAFEVKPLPWQAQLSSFRDAAITDANNDGKPDVLLAGNYYENNIEMGRYDADFGSLLMNDGKGGFAYETLNGVVIKGQSRKIRDITIGGKKAFVIARNNDSAMVIRFVPPVK